MTDREPKVVEESNDENSGRNLRIVSRTSFEGSEIFDVEEVSFGRWERIAVALDSLAEARESARLSHLHVVERRALGRRDVHHRDLPRTPWGQADNGTQYGPGVFRYGTPGHGGFKLSAAENRRVPPQLRNKGGWYEEDAEWSKVAFAFPELFTTRERTNARKTLVDSYPREFMELTGETLTAADSQTLAKEAFQEATKDRWVVISAAGQDDGSVRCHATIGGRRQEFGGPPVEERLFSVPKGEYPRNVGFGFVIDETRHEEIENPSAGPRP